MVGSHAAAEASGTRVVDSRTLGSAGGGERPLSRQGGSTAGANPGETRSDRAAAPGRFTRWGRVRRSAPSPRLTRGAILPRFKGPAVSYEPPPPPWHALRVGARTGGSSSNSGRTILNRSVAMLPSPSLGRGSWGEGTLPDTRPFIRTPCNPWARGAGPCGFGSADPLVGDRTRYVGCRPGDRWAHSASRPPGTPPVPRCARVGGQRGRGAMRMVTLPTSLRPSASVTR